MGPRFSFRQAENQIFLHPHSAYQDLTDGHRTPQDWGQAVGAGLGLTATILGLTVSAPISVPIGIGAMIITFFSYTLDDSADHQQTKY